MEVVDMINRPLYTEKIMVYTDTPFVKVLTGVRRCGKSTILKMIMEKLQNESDTSCMPPYLLQQHGKDRNQSKVITVSDGTCGYQCYS